MDQVFNATRGQTLGRVLKHMALAGGNHTAAAEAAFRAGEVETAGLLTKAQAASTLGQTWGHEASGLSTLRAQFVELVNSSSIPGLIDVRRIPVRTRILTTGTGSSAVWLGEGQAVPVGGLTLEETSLSPLTVGAMVLLTRELLESGAPYLEQLLVKDLVRASRNAIDYSFLSPTNAGTPGVMPPSITHDAVTITASGGLNDEAGIAALKGDLRRVLAAYTGDWGSAVFICNSSLAMAMQLAGFPLLSPSGENVIPVVHTGSVPGDSGSPEADFLVLADSSALINGDLDATISASDQGDIALTEAIQTSVSPTPSNISSLWATKTIALKAIIQTNWHIPASGRVVVLSGIPRA